MPLCTDSPLCAVEAGLEPAASELTVPCSAIELLDNVLTAKRNRPDRSLLVEEVGQQIERVLVEVVIAFLDTNAPPKKISEQ